MSCGMRIARMQRESEQYICVYIYAQIYVYMYLCTFMCVCPWKHDYNWIEVYVVLGYGMRLAWSWPTLGGFVHKYRIHTHIYIYTFGGWLLCNSARTIILYGIR